MKRYQVLVVCCSKGELRSLVAPSAFRRAVESDLGPAGKFTLMAFGTDGEEADLFVETRRTIHLSADFKVEGFSRVVEDEAVLAH